MDTREIWGCYIVHYFDCGNGFKGIYTCQNLNCILYLLKCLFMSIFQLIGYQLHLN